MTLLDKLVQSECDRVEFSDGVSEKVLLVSRCHIGVALNKALGQTVDEKTEGMVYRLKTLQYKIKNCLINAARSSLHAKGKYYPVTASKRGTNFVIYALLKIWERDQGMKLAVAYFSRAILYMYNFRNTSFSVYLI